MRCASTHSTNASQRWATLRQVHVKSRAYTVWIGRGHRTDWNRRYAYFEAGSSVRGERSARPPSQRQGPRLCSPTETRPTATVRALTCALAGQTGGRHRLRMFPGHAAYMVADQAATIPFSGDDFRPFLLSFSPIVGEPANAAGEHRMRSVPTAAHWQVQRRSRLRLARSATGKCIANRQDRVYPRSPGPRLADPQPAAKSVQSHLDAADADTRRA